MLTINREAGFDVVEYFFHGEWLRVKQNIETCPAPVESVSSDVSLMIETGGRAKCRESGTRVFLASDLSQPSSLCSSLSLQLSSVIMHFYRAGVLLRLTSLVCVSGLCYSSIQVCFAAAGPWLC